MQAMGTGPRSGPAVDANAFFAPLTFLANEHYRQHRVCAILEHLATNPSYPSYGAWPEDLETVYDYLAREFELHLADEEESLLPAIADRCANREQTTEIAVTMRRRHKRQRALCGKLIADVECLIEGRPLPDPERFDLDALGFAADLRKTMHWENEVVLPLARRNLRNPDYARMGQGMAARRGVALEPWA
jgi:hemerythrin-like domain-containing protein